MAELSEETKTLATIIRHRNMVSLILTRLAQALELRAHAHDLSKLSLEELSGFVNIQQIARKHKIGSPEYEDSIKNSAVQLHYTRNPHHPEYYINGVRDMGLLDLIEMVADWLAASLTYGQTTFEESLPIQAKRFKLTDEQVNLIKLIARGLEL